MQNTANSRLALATTMIVAAGLLAPLSMSTPAFAAGTGGNFTCETSNFSGGNGTSSNPYQISNVDELKELGDCINQNQVNTSTHYFALTQNIDLGNVSWRPLGSNPNNTWELFNGHLDGQGFKILNMRADLSGQGQSNSHRSRGLFLYTGPGSIKNLTLEGTLLAERFWTAGALTGWAAGTNVVDVTSSVAITCEGTATSTSREIGGLIGRVISGGITRISGSRLLSAGSGAGIDCLGKSGTSTDISGSNRFLVGGLVGAVEDAGRLTITNSHVNADVSVGGFGVAVGGLVGGGRQTAPGAITLTNSSYSGAITTSSSTGASVTSQMVAGGLIGSTVGELDVDGSFSEGSIHIGSNRNIAVGGLVGRMKNGSSTAISTVSNSYSTVDIEFANSGSASEGAVGGLVGYHESGTTTTTWSSGSIKQTGGTALTNQGAVIGQLIQNTSNNYNFFSASSFPNFAGFGGGSILENENRTFAYRRIYQEELSTLATYSVTSTLYFNMRSFPDAGGTSVWLLCEEPFLRWQGIVDSCYPRLLTAEIDSAAPTEVSMAFSRDVNTASGSFAVPSALFTVTDQDGIALPTVSLSRKAGGDNTELTLTLGVAVASTDSIKLAYSDPSPSDNAVNEVIEDASGLDLKSFSDFSVMNGSTLGPRADILADSFVASSNFMTAQTEIAVQLTECPSAAFDPSLSFAVSADGAPASIVSETVSCSFQPLIGPVFSMRVSPLLFRDQVIVVTYAGDSGGVNGPDSLISPSDLLTFAAGTSVTLADKAFAAWRPVFQSAQFTATFDALEITFQTYGEGIAFSQTPGAMISGNHPLWQHLTFTGASGVGTPLISGSKLTLPLDRTIYRNAPLSVTYTDPNPTTNDNLDGLIEMAVGQTSLKFDAKDFALAVDTSTAPTQPVAQGATVSVTGTEIAIVFSEDMSATLPPASAILLTVAGETVAAESLTRSVATDTLIVGLSSASAILSGQSVTVAYSDPRPQIEDSPTDAIGSLAGDWDALSFSLTASNNSTALPPTPPAPDSTPTPEVEPEPAPTPEAEPEPSPTPEPGPTPAPDVSPSPTPTPEPTPTVEPSPDAQPDSSPAETPASTSTPAPDPTPQPTETQEPQPDPTPAPVPTREAAVDEEPSAVAQPAPTPSSGPIREITVEEILDGAITLQPGTETIVLPALVLEQVVLLLAPTDDLLGSTLASESLLEVTTGRTSISTFVSRLTEARISARDAGDFIQFTLMVPGFEASTMSVRIDKQVALNVGLLTAAVLSFAAAALLAFLFLRRRRQRQRPQG